MYKIFNGKKIVIRQLEEKDLNNVKKFQDFINGLVEEDVQITHNKKYSLKEEKRWLEGELNNIKNRTTVFLLAEDGGMIVGTTSITLGMGRKNHVGEFGITIREGYRGMGLGNYLMGEILKLAQKRLKSAPKIFRLSVFPTNKPAMGLYQEHGFKKVAKIPKQIRYEGKLIDEVIMILSK